MDTTIAGTEGVEGQVAFDFLVALRMRGGRNGHFEGLDAHGVLSEWVVGKDVLGSATHYCDVALVEGREELGRVEVVRNY